MSTAPAIDPWTGAFVDAAKEDAYLRETASAREARARSGVALFAAMWLAWIAKDVISAPQAWGWIALLRAVALLPALRLWRVPAHEDPRILQRQLAWNAAFVALVVNVPTLLYTHLDGQVIATRLGLVFAMTAWLTLGAGALLAVDLLIVIPGLLIWAARSHPTPGSLLATMLVLLGTVAASALFHALANALMRDHQAALWSAEEQVRAREQLVEALAHELHRPLGTARMHVRLARERPDAAPRFLKHVDKDLERLTERISSVLRLGRVQRGAQDTTEVLLSDLCRAVESELSERTQPVRLDVVLQADGTVRADFLLLRDAVVSLVVQALERATAGVRLELSAGHPQAAVVIDDDGDPPEAEADPMRAGPPAKRDFSVAMARRIAQAHGGDLRISRSALGGTCVTLTLASALGE